MTPPLPDILGFYLGAVLVQCGLGVHDLADRGLRRQLVGAHAADREFQRQEVRVVVNRASALSDDIVLIHGDRGVIRPPWIRLARNFRVKLVDNGVTAAVDVTMEFYRRHGSDSDILVRE